MAYQGVDLRDLFRPGSGLTWRRLAVLVEALPPEAPLWGDIRAAEERARKPTPEQIRARADYWKQRREKEAAT